LKNKNIKNIIFDLGGVIVDLDTSKTIGAFSELSGLPEGDIWKMAEESIFQQYEKGEIESETFREGLRQLLNINSNDNIIDKAWNAMIGNTPIHRLEWMSSLQQQFRVFILSNTNHIHINYVHDTLNTNYGIENFTNHVEKVYYSQLIGLRKPDKEIFEFVIDQNNLEPQSTLFLDDNSDNIKGAESIGIQTAQVAHPEHVPQILTNAGIQI